MLRLVCVSVATLGAVAMQPNNNCCASAGDPAACNAQVDFTFDTLPGGARRMHCPNDPTNPNNYCSFDNCVGPTGVDCQGVQQTIDLSPVGKITVDLVKPKYNDDRSRVELPVTVGSILHDLCCISHPHGAFCDSSNYPIAATVNLNGNADNSCACLLEWRKAAWNLIRGRSWPRTFNTATQSADLTPRPDVVRTAWLPVSSGTSYVKSDSGNGMTEVAATAQLCAPSGTKLDCPKNDRNCEVPCVGLTCTACDPALDHCSRGQRKRWNKDGRSHAFAGDHQFCCSGRFKEVKWTTTSRYGVCK